LLMFDPNIIYTAVYYDGEQKKYYVKRFQLPENTSINRAINFIGDEKGSKLIAFSLDHLPRLQFEIKKDGSSQTEVEVVPLADFISIKSYKAKGKRLSNFELKKIKLIEPLPYTAPVDEKEQSDAEADDVNSNNNISDVKTNSDVDTEKNPKEVDTEKKITKPSVKKEKYDKDKTSYTDIDDEPQLELDF